MYFLDKQKLKVKTLFRLSLVLVVIGSTQTNNHQIILVTDLLNLIIWLKKQINFEGSISNLSTKVAASPAACAGSTSGPAPRGSRGSTWAAGQWTNYGSTFGLPACLL